MKTDRKGTVAVMDAMLFIVILGLTVSAVFVHSPHDSDDGLSAERIHRELFSVELQASDVFEVKDSRLLCMDEILAVHIGTSEGNVPEIIFEMLRTMVPVSHGFFLDCIYDGSGLRIGDGSGAVVSEYRKEFIVAGKTLFTALVIH